MSQSVLSGLRSDHRLFAVLLDAAEDQIDALEGHRPADTALLKAIAGYFEDYPPAFHRPLEEVVYGHLACYMPAFAEDVYGLIDDHRDVAARTRAFREATERLDVHDPESRHQFAPVARDFIEHERIHLMAEEQLFFPYAERLLSRQQWAEVERAVDRQNVNAVLKATVGAFPQFQHMLTTSFLDRSRP
jgi:hemerythrin-like domain-containing protein